MSKIFRLVMLGAPGSGKGTISGRIVKNFCVTHISTGDIFRMNIENNTNLGKEVKGFIDNGQLIPDDLVIKCIFERIAEAGCISWLLDGFPRTTNQAEKLQSVRPVDGVINLKVPKDVIIDRVRNRWVHLPSGRVYNVDFNAPKIPFKDDITGEDLIQRSDDNPDTVRKRFELYELCTKPVIDYYRDLNLIHDFDGAGTNEIWPKINQFLLKIESGKL